MRLNASFYPSLVWSYVICKDGSLRSLVLSEAVFLRNLSASAQSSDAARINLNCLSRGLFVEAALDLVIARLRC